jgi:hypothetical protein
MAAPETIDDALAKAGVAAPVGTIAVKGSDVQSLGGTISIHGAQGKSEAKGRVRLGSSQGLTHVAQGAADGVQLLAVLSDNKAAKSITYTFAGKKLALEDNGSVTVLDGQGQIVGAVAAPWAKDANGEAVSTNYRVNGSQLIQTVETTADTAYPVVADPFYWWGYQAQLSRSQTLTATTAAGACGLLSGVLPGWAFKLAALYCGAIALYANHIYSQGKCLNVNVFYTGQVTYNSRWC